MKTYLTNCVDDKNNVFILIAKISELLFLILVCILNHQLDVSNYLLEC